MLALITFICHPFLATFLAVLSNNYYDFTRIPLSLRLEALSSPLYMGGL